MILALLIFNACLTWYMTGLIWFVQVVHYPLFDRAAKDQFIEFATRHCQLTGTVVVAPMVGEAISALILAIYWQGSSKTLVWVNFGLVVGIWLCTAIFSIPSHNKFCTMGFSEATLNYLVQSNWIRTTLWTCRALILAWLLFTAKSSAPPAS
jgi:hypothetical protein